MNRKEALDAAAKAVLTDRNAAYGDPEDNFRTTAEIMTAYLRGRGFLRADAALAAFDVAALMCALKLARLVTTPGKADTWVDLAGYAACGVECATSGGDKAPPRPSASPIAVVDPFGHAVRGVGVKLAGETSMFPPRPEN